ncbi:hypothetical protein WMY93_023049 [Mugilogobius chulae]|uniref:Uncharacterized protein n=1 Tax=Mugilogobius chulae TaxID=88201 RepID=A0AAW0N4B3_9GOBI
MTRTNLTGRTKPGVFLLTANFHLTNNLTAFLESRSIVLLVFESGDLHFPACSRSVGLLMFESGDLRFTCTLQVRGLLMFESGDLRFTCTLQAICVYLHAPGRGPPHAICVLPARSRSAVLHVFESGDLHFPCTLQTQAICAFLVCSKPTVLQVFESGNLCFLCPLQVNGSPHVRGAPHAELSDLHFPACSRSAVLLSCFAAQSRSVCFLFVRSRSTVLLVFDSGDLLFLHAPVVGHHSHGGHRGDGRSSWPHHRPVSGPLSASKHCTSLKAVSNLLTTQLTFQPLHRPRPAPCSTPATPTPAPTLKMCPRRGRRRPYTR